MSLHQEELTRYEEDGAICVRRLIDPAAARRLLVDARPILQARDSSLTKDMSKALPGYWDCVAPLCEVAAELTGSSTIRLYGDHLFLKQSGNSQPTVFHQDLSYWPFQGDQICAAWLALAPVRKSAGELQYVRGSHKRGYNFQPIDTGRAVTNPEHPDYLRMTKPIDFFDEEVRAGEEFLSWEMEPGDVMWHHCLTVHGAYANNSAEHSLRAGLTVRFLGDDVRWDPRPFLRTPDKVPPVAAGEHLRGNVYPLLWTRDDGLIPLPN